LEVVPKNQHRCHSVASEESPVIVSFLLKHIKHEILHFVQDDKERPNGVILSEAKNLPFTFHFLTYSPSRLI